MPGPAHTIGFVLVLLAVATPIPTCATELDSLVNTDVQRTINIASQVVKINVLQTIENQGSSAVHSVILAHDDQLSRHLAYVCARERGATPCLPMEGNIVKVSIAPLSKVVLELDFVYTHALRPFPSRCDIGINEKSERRKRRRNEEKNSNEGRLDMEQK